MAAEQPEAGYLMTDTCSEMVSAGLSGATTLRAPLPDSPQEVRDVGAQEDIAQVQDPEALANVGASIGQTTPHTLGFMSSVGLGCTSCEPAPDYSRFSLPQPFTPAMDILSVEVPHPTLGTSALPTAATRRLPADPSLAPNVGPAGTCMSVGGCLLYTSPSPRDRQKSRMPSSA